METSVSALPVTSTIVKSLTEGVLTAFNDSVTDSVFLRWRRGQPTILANFPQKLHRNKKFDLGRGRSLSVPL